MICLFNQRQKKLLIITVEILLFLSFLLIVGLTGVLAQSTTNDYGLYNTANAAGLPVGQTDPIIIAATIINVILGLVGVLAVLLIIYGGFSWMTAAGNEEKIGKAKKVLSGAIIGLIIIMGSFIISSFVMKNIKSVTKATTPAAPSKTCAELKGTCINPKETFCDKNKLFPTSDCPSQQACCYDASS